MKVKVFNNNSQLLEIKEDWNKLFNEGSYSVFQSFDFNYYSWKYELESDKRNQLAITVIRTNRGVLAIFPFYIDSNKQLRFINDLHFDFCDFIAIESINFSIVYDYLKQEVDFKSMRLINVKKEANIYKAVRDLNSINKVVQSTSEYSILILDKGTFPYNVPYYRSHQKHRINKILRKNEEKQFLIVNYQEHIFPMKDILLLKEKMIGLGIRKDNFLTNERILLIECLYNSGIIILHIIKDKGKTNVINILLKKSPSEFMFWIDLFDDSKLINIYSYINFIKSSSEAQSVIINFGRGRYPYKTSNFLPEFHKLYHMYIFFNKWQKLRFLILNQIRSISIAMYNKIK